VVVGWVIKTDTAVGDKSQNGGGGDALGDARTPGTGGWFQNHGAVEVCPAPREGPHRGVRAAPGEDQAGQAELGEGRGGREDLDAADFHLHGQLSLVEGAKFAGRQAAFGLKLQVPKAWPARQRA
jgi:hypothetical protein